MSTLIGLTGGIGSGKSLAASYFKELGAKIIHADHISRQLVEPGRAAWKEISEEFFSLLPATEGSAHEFKELVSNFLRTIPLNSDNATEQFTRYLSLTVKGSTTLLSQMLDLALMPKDTPVQQLNLLTELLSLTQFKSLINKGGPSVFGTR